MAPGCGDPRGDRGPRATHNDLPTSRRALALGNSSIAARIARFLDGHPDTAAGMYGHDRRALRAVLDATADVDADPAASFYEARRLTAQIGAASHPFIPRGRPGWP
jgi:hypothetical protein